MSAKKKVVLFCFSSMMTVRCTFIFFSDDSAVSTRSLATPEVVEVDLDTT